MMKAPETLGFLAFSFVCKSKIASAPPGGNNEARRVAGLAVVL